MRKRVLILLCVVGFVIAFAAFTKLAAMPPHPDLQQQIDNGEVPLPYAISHRAELLARGVDSPVELPGKLSARKSAAPYIGGQNILCILVEFSDKPSLVAAEDFDTLMFVNQFGSVRHFYNEVSYDTYDIVTVNLPSSIGWQTAPQTYAYYCNGANGLGGYPQNCQKLVEDLVNLVDPAVDFSNYDNDGDGFVEGLMVVHTGPGAEFGGGSSYIWSHKWGTHAPMLKDGKYVFEYCIQPEYWSSPGDITLGVFVHELGHLLFGLPDLYDTDYSSRGVGKWSLMASGSWNGPSGMGGSPAHPDAWSRIFCGFTSETKVTSNVTAQAIPNVETNSSGAIFRLWTNGDAGNEYFLIENRRLTGYDSYLPSQGLLIWHIDDGVSLATANDAEWYPGHILSGHYRVALEQADNLYDLEHNTDYGDAGDLFPGSTDNTTFGAVTSPNSNDYSGASTLVAVNNVSASAATMSADLSVALVADVNDFTFDHTLPSDFQLGQNFPNPFNPSTQIRFELPRTSTTDLSIYNVLGQKVEQLAKGELPAGGYTFTWDARNTNGSEMPSGIYFYQLRTDETVLTRKMLLIR